MLPIGSVVTLVNGSQKLMILNIGQIIKQNEKDVYFDYSAAPYPVGLDTQEQVYYFNRDNVSEVVFQGFQDEDGKHFGDLYEQWIEETKDEIQRGKVKNDTDIF
ncbi:DUF4176 domain-containing protein [Bombilactobacillus thymidiniphilus]|uniref:DUF4176 domain-containing protein n=1 Tax=Bombilactobacillus thymidiniphilus TaxID=2923363 RepID=A0ABY4PBD0_9LACO|nr:DUF4176 domain-containing protein [Bombilactobacillus thymidiniphilus]UQS83059.1 DUF4176 domain-containing protein [Bombilactobacillus thymidiniphilus]